MNKFVAAAFRDRQMRGQFDFEGLEYATREIMHKCGASILEHLFRYEDGSSLNRQCNCGGNYINQKIRFKTVHSILGSVKIKRLVQQCVQCKQWRIPHDIVLDIRNTVFSPGMHRIMAKCGAIVSFDKARDLIKELAGRSVTAKNVERISESIGEDIRLSEQKMQRFCNKSKASSVLYIATDGTGVPVLKKETQGRSGKAEDGVAKTREVKLGAIFTQSKTDKKGNPIRDPFSTTYIGKIESVGEFGPRLLNEASNRGVFHTKQTVVLGDGAPWIWNLADKYFPKALQIIDYYHATEHLADIAKVIYPQSRTERDVWLKTTSNILWEGPISRVIHILQALQNKHSTKPNLKKMTEYFYKNHYRMEYGDFRRKGFFIGSGVIEAGCRSLIGHRLKQSGMHWSVKGANDIIALKCCIESGYFEDYWDSRLAS